MRWLFTFFLATSLAHAAISFRHEVLPVLTRQGCNAGTCHGSPSGKGGFALSLFAFDAKADYNALTKDFLSRRIDPIDPHLSLLLRKPSTDLSHKGGLKLARDSREYKIIHDWIAAGTPMDAPNTPACEGITLHVEGAAVLRWPRPTTRLPPE